MSLRRISAISTATLLVILAISVGVAISCGLDFTKTVNLLTFIVLTLTLLVLCIYTAYTRLLHSASLEQTRLSRMPSLIQAENYDAPRNKKQFLVRNIGHGVAVNIRIELVEAESVPNLSFRFDEIDSIQPDQEREARVQTFINNEFFEENWTMLHLDKGDHEVTRTVIFKFQDIDGRRYRQKNVITEGVYNHGIVENEI